LAHLNAPATKVERNRTGSVARLLSRNKARRIAANVAKLPGAIAELHG
jgi:hypothetical protein